MPTELLHPFAIGPDGAIATTGDPDRQIRQHVLSIVSTQPGERVVLTKYGVPTRELLFDSTNELVAESIASRAKEALMAYEPGIVLKGVTPIPTGEGSGIAKVEVDYIRRESATSSSSLSRQTNTAVIAVGGHVSEVVRG